MRQSKRNSGRMRASHSGVGQRRQSIALQDLPEGWAAGINPAWPQGSTAMTGRVKDPSVAPDLSSRAAIRIAR
jgi:hypothetical protein